MAIWKFYFKKLKFWKHYKVNQRKKRLYVYNLNGRWRSCNVLRNGSNAKCRGKFDQMKMMRGEMQHKFIIIWLNRYEKDDDLYFLMKHDNYLKEICKLQYFIRL